MRSWLILATVLVAFGCGGASGTDNTADATNGGDASADSEGDGGLGKNNGANEKCDDPLGTTVANKVAAQLPAWLSNYYHIEHKYISTVEQTTVGPKLPGAKKPVRYKNEYTLTIDLAALVNYQVQEQQQTATDKFLKCTANDMANAENRDCYAIGQKQPEAGTLDYWYQGILGLSINTVSRKLVSSTQLDIGMNLETTNRESWGERGLDIIKQCYYWRNGTYDYNAATYPAWQPKEGNNSYPAGTPQGEPEMLFCIDPAPSKSGLIYLDFEGEMALHYMSRLDLNSKYLFTKDNLSFEVPTVKIEKASKNMTKPTIKCGWDADAQLWQTADAWFKWFEDVVDLPDTCKQFVTSVPTAIEDNFVHAMFETPEQWEVDECKSKLTDQTCTNNSDCDSDNCVHNVVTIPAMFGIPEQVVDYGYFCAKSDAQKADCSKPKSTVLSEQLSEVLAAVILNAKAGGVKLESGAIKTNVEWISVGAVDDTTTTSGCQTKKNKGGLRVVWRAESCDSPYVTPQTNASPVIYASIPGTESTVYESMVPTSFRVDVEDLSGDLKQIAWSVQKPGETAYKAQTPKALSGECASDLLALKLNVAGTWKVKALVEDNASHTATKEWTITVEKEPEANEIPPGPVYQYDDGIQNEHYDYGFDEP